MKNGNRQTLPKGWQCRRFGECAQFINGRAYAQDELLASGTPVLRIQNLNGGDRWYYSNLNLPDEKYCEAGDLLYAWSASFGPYRFNGPRSIFHYHIWRVIPGDELDKNFAFHLLREITDEIKLAAHGVAMLHMTKAGMEAWQIPVPPLVEQRRIAEILDNTDTLRAKRRLVLTELDSLTQSIFLELFGDPVLNPKRWVLKRLSDIGTLDRGVSKNRPRNAPELLGGPFPLIQTGDVANCGGYIRSFQSSYSKIGLRQSKMWPTDTLLITIAANIAKTGILTFDACFPDSIVGFRADDNATVEFVRVWLSFLQESIEAAAPESAQKNINLAILRNLSVPVPPITLQREFARRVATVEKLKAVQRTSLAEMDALFASLQHRAFQGQL